ncbi:C40 family peptidase [Krasilnikovia sp. MM14-A1259]|uniref:C40 family peptidase n=1 Tax=Krasilnikovia sp. MM14-A1259 TaxID=3373539 RepID=UPI00399D4FEC
MQLPTGGQARTAVAFALAQLGEPYVFGANGPNAWDCSSLMQQSWAASGVAIPRVTFDQVKTGVAVPGLAAMQPGDLIFIPGSLGSANNPATSACTSASAQTASSTSSKAPHTGDHVKVSPVSAWTNTIVSIRRPVTTVGRE